MCVLAVMYLGQIVEMAEAMELCDKPFHPYTQALFTAALPVHPDEPRQKLGITGEVVSTLARPRVAASTRVADGDGESAAEPAGHDRSRPGHRVACRFSNCRSIANARNADAAC